MVFEKVTRLLKTEPFKLHSNFKNIEFKKLPANTWQYVINNKRKSMLMALFIVALIAGSLFLIKRNQNKTTYANYKVTLGDITETLDVVGSVQAVPSAVLTWKTDGIVADFKVVIGDKVKTGDILMRLTDSSLDPTILQANANLLDAKLALDKLLLANTDQNVALKALNDAEYEYLLAKNKIDLINWQNTPLETIQAAREAYQLSEQTYWQAKRALETLNNSASESEKINTQNILNAATTDKDKKYLALRDLLGRYYNYETETLFILYDQSVDALEEARLTWEKYQDMSDEIAAAKATVQSYQNTVNNAAIIAPFDGTITNIMVNAGEMVNNGTNAVQIDNLEMLMITIDVSEVDINNIKAGQNVDITFDALPGKTFHGTVSKVSNAGDSSSGLVQFSITITITDADESIKPGFSATASIITNQVTNVLMVPTSAIQKGQNRSFLIIRGLDGNPSIVPVAIGAASDSMTQVISEQIKEGDVVLVPVSDGTTTSLRGGFGMYGILGGEPPADRQPPSGGNFQPRQGN